MNGLMGEVCHPQLAKLINPKGITPSGIAKFENF
jgi:hypothetical protein